MLEGTITVAGSDSLTIDLKNNKHPDRISCTFKHKHIHVPCNPHIEDQVQWSCSQDASGNYHLTITWSTGSDRDIEWGAYW